MTETTEILKERGKRYGRFDGHADVTQRLKQVIATELHIRRKELANDQQEALDMICHKIGRIINGDANYEDSWRDIAGYAQLVADRLLEPVEMKEKEKPKSSDLEFIKYLDSRIHLYESELEEIRKRKPIGDRSICNKETDLVSRIIGCNAYRDELLSKIGKDSVESIADRLKEPVINGNGNQGITVYSNGERISVDELHLPDGVSLEKGYKPLAPEPVLPTGWIRPSKSYPQVAEDPSTRWQYIYDGERWLRLVKPIHEMSEKELRHLDVGGCIPYPIVFLPEPLSDTAADSMAKAVRMMGSGWKIVESANLIIAKDDSGLAHIWNGEKWLLVPPYAHAC